MEVTGAMEDIMKQDMRRGAPPRGWGVCAGFSRVDLKAVVFDQGPEGSEGCEP